MKNIHIYPSWRLSFLFLKYPYFERTIEQYFSKTFLKYFVSIRLEIIDQKIVRYPSSFLLLENYSSNSFYKNIDWKLIRSWSNLAGSSRKHFVKIPIDNIVFWSYYRCTYMNLLLITSYILRSLNIYIYVYVYKILPKSNLHKREVSVDEYSGWTSRPEQNTRCSKTRPSLISFFSYFSLSLLLEKLNGNVTNCFENSSLKTTWRIIMCNIIQKFKLHVVQIR